MTNSRCLRKSIRTGQAWSNTSSKCFTSLRQSLSQGIAEPELFSSCCSVFSMRQFFLLFRPTSLHFQKKKKRNSPDCFNRYQRVHIHKLGTWQAAGTSLMLPPGVKSQARINSPVRGTRAPVKSWGCFLYFPYRLPDLSLDHWTQWDIVKEKENLLCDCNALGFKRQSRRLSVPLAYSE